jgi:hypothetical protein
MNKYMIKFIGLCLYLKFKIMEINYIENRYKWNQNQVIRGKI